MLNDNVLTWNVRNWITVVLMFFAGWAVLTGVSLGIRMAFSGKEKPADE